MVGQSHSRRLASQNDQCATTSSKPRGHRTRSVQLELAKGMITCSNCAKKFIPKTVGIQLCPFCGYAQGEGVPNLVVEELEEAPGTERMLIRTMGRLALLLLVLLFGALLFMGYNTQQASIESKTTEIRQ